MTNQDVQAWKNWKVAQNVPKEKIDYSSCVDVRPISPLERKAERHKDICDKLNDIYIQKNHDYGDSFSKTFQEEGMAMARIRLTDKLERFKRLTKTEGKVKDESIIDTLIDLANYSIMTIMEIEK
jgi:hypothetical protein